MLAVAGLRGVLSGLSTDAKRGLNDGWLGDVMRCQLGLRGNSRLLWWRLGYLLAGRGVVERERLVERRHVVRLVVGKSEGGGAMGGDDDVCVV